MLKAWTVFAYVGTSSWVFDMTWGKCIYTHTNIHDNTVVDLCPVAVAMSKNNTNSTSR